MTQEQAKTIQILMEQLELLAKATEYILVEEPELAHKNILAMVEIAKIIYEIQSSGS